MLLVLSACPRRPDPPTRVHGLDDFGLELTLPGTWRGGKVRGAGYIFTSGNADTSLSINDDVAGIPMTTAGLETFLTERVVASVVSSGDRTFGARKGVEGIGTSRTAPDTRLYIGAFTGPKGPISVQLTTRGLPPATADAEWASVTSSLK
ncbi:MAG: hypothetical protein U0228_11085 [Myxococcaceae bacterium]